MAFANAGVEGWAAGEWRDNGDIEVRGGTILTKDEIHACVFDLAIHRTSKGCNGLLDVHLGAIVRVYHIGTASSHCGMLAIDTTAVSAPRTAVLLSIHGFATDLPRCAFVGAWHNNA